MSARRTSLLFSIIFAMQLHAQQTINNLMQMSARPIGTLQVDTHTAVYLPMDFASAVFENTQALRKIKNVQEVYAVALVYTKYRELESYNQPELNRQRYESFKRIYPEIYNQPAVEWYALEQRQATTKEAAENCFHGFVLYKRVLPPATFVDKEISSISSIIDSYKDTLIWIPENKVYKVKRVRIETGNYIPLSGKKQKAGKKYSRSGFGMREAEVKVRKDSTLVRTTGGYFKRVSSFDSGWLPGTHEFYTLTTNKWSPKTAVVADVTASMTPFSAEVMLWLRYQPEIVKNGRIAFFNDGDGTPDMFKKIGKTGGIHFVKDPQFDSVYSTMKLAMKNGMGGDIPENNIEAALEAIRKWPDTDTVLLISDSKANIKDMVLMDKITVPVSVLLCGNTDHIKKDYIDLVVKTGGRLFFLGTEIRDLKNMKNGSKISINNHTYEYRKGAIYFVR